MLSFHKANFLFSIYAFLICSYAYFLMIFRYKPNPSYNIAQNSLMPIFITKLYGRLRAWYKKSVTNFKKTSPISNGQPSKYVTVIVFFINYYISVSHNSLRARESQSSTSVLSLSDIYMLRTFLAPELDVSSFIRVEEICQNVELLKTSLWL